MNINPKEVIERGIVIPCEYTKIQQVGIDITIAEEIIIKKGEYASIDCNEESYIPENCWALVLHRSSFNRKGIFIISGIYDAGFRGKIGCTIYAHQDIVIPKNERIAQIVVMRGESANMYSGQYQDQGLKNE